MSVTERIRIVRLTADRSRRAAVSRLLYSPLLRWRFGAPAADQLLIVPQELRTADPSFWHEIQLGQFGLAGTIAELKGRSPFEIRPPNAAWTRSLHGFGWLRHLDAADQEEARAAARRLAVEWIVRRRSHPPLATDPAVTGRRLISWLSNSSLLLDRADVATYEAITKSLGAELVWLAANWRQGADGYPRLLALIALVLADLCVAGHDQHLMDAERHFAQELSRQILADGGHVSRNPAVLVELMLDLLPLRQCFAARNRQPPEALLNCLRRIPVMLRFLRLGDGMLARFNGVSVALPAGLATVLAYDDRHDVQPGLAPNARYARLSRHTTVVLMDAGGSPPLEAAAEAQSGCLSFEMSTGTQAVFVNGGAPGAAESSWRAAARATASHNTLCLAEKSSAELVINRRLEALIGGAVIKGPHALDVHVVDQAGAIEAVASHDGYRERFGLIHTRRLVLSADGERLSGLDRLAGARVSVRLREDLPFAIHFHLHPEIDCRLAAGGRSADILLRGGKVWRFSADDLIPSIEDGTYFADSSGARNALQIVLRGSTFGETEVAWRVEAVR
ncbi:MAG: heparinase II/III family protein [Hyphomicrobium sp.]